MLKRVKTCVWALLCACMICASFFFGCQSIQNTNNPAKTQDTQTEQTPETTPTPETPSPNQNPDNNITAPPQTPNNTWTDEKAVALLSQAIQVFSNAKETAPSLIQEDTQESVCVQDLVFTREKPSVAVDKLAYAHYFLVLSQEILQSADGGEYKLSKTVCGEASTTPNREINLHLNGNTSAPLLTFYAERQEDGLLIKLDWDFRQEYFEKYYEKFHCVLTVNVRIVCDLESKALQKILLNGYYTGANGDFFSSAFYINEACFYFLQGENTFTRMQSDGQSSLPQVFNSGDCDYSKVINHSVERIRLVRVSLTTGASEPLCAWLREDLDLYTQMEVAPFQAEQDFSSFYHSIYACVKQLPLRDDNALLPKIQNVENFEMPAQRAGEFL